MSKLNKILKNVILIRISLLSFPVKIVIGICGVEEQPRHYTTKTTYRATSLVYSYHANRHMIE